MRDSCTPRSKWLSESSSTALADQRTTLGSRFSGASSASAGARGSRSESAVAARAAAARVQNVQFTPRQLQIMLSLAGIGCCVAMSMPQVHIVALCTDLGYGPAVGAEMLSLMLPLDAAPSSCWVTRKPYRSCSTTSPLGLRTVTAATL